MLSNMQSTFFNFTTFFPLLFLKSIKMQTGALIRGSKTSEAWDSTKI